MVIVLILAIVQHYDHFNFSCKEVDVSKEEHNEIGKEIHDNFVSDWCEQEIAAWVQKYNS